MFRRGKSIDQDATMLQAFVETPDFDRLPNYLKAKIHLFLGSYSTKRGEVREARHHWTTAVSLGGSTDVALEARARLQGVWREIGYEG
jgi:hypothetical protein